MGKNRQNDDEDIVVTLDLEDGTSVDCDILTIFTVNKRDYIALLPLDENEKPTGDGEVYLYRYFEDENGPSLENIEDDDEYEAAADKFDEWLDEQEFDDMTD